MDTLRQIMLAACFAGAALSLSGAAAFGERLRGQAGFLFSLIFALAVISPVASGEVRFDIPDFSREELALEASEKYDGMLLDRIEDNLEKAALEALEAEGIVCDEICIRAYISEDSRISITKADVSCDDFGKACDVLRVILGSDVNVTEVSAGNEAE